MARDITYSLLPTANTRNKRIGASSFVRSVGQYEPPVIESIVAVTHFWSLVEKFHCLARIWESLFWLVVGIVFDFMRRAVSPWAAVVAIAFYFVLPFSVQASRSFQPDPLLVWRLLLGFISSFVGLRSRLGSGQFLQAFSLDLPRSSKLSSLFREVFLYAIAMVLFTLKKDFWKSKQVWAMAAIMVVPAFLFLYFAESGSLH